ncbi:MAG: magnesium protoporphyrin IX methyltransferase [Silicimonas sp.]|nr:magnesium protoporphyrin IX methyltransferase [Silicimonas sp.]
MTYVATRDRVEHYFDRTATKTWERLTSDAPVSGIRATVRAGRDRMRDLILAQLPPDLTGASFLDAGCGTGALAVELAGRGADVVAVDISPELIKIAEKRCPDGLAGRIRFASGDMLDESHGHFDYIVAMDSLIYYEPAMIAQVLGGLRPRLGTSMIFTVPPKTMLLTAMWRTGKLFPHSDRSPTMVPQSARQIGHAMAEASTAGSVREIERVTSGFYISTALEFAP